MKNLDQPKKRWNAPVALALGVVILITVTIFGLGFWAGVSSADMGRDRGATFEKPISKVMSEPLPKELP